MTRCLLRFSVVPLLGLCACGPPESEAASQEASSPWEGVAPLPEARSFHRAARGSDGRIYVFAGRHGSEMRKRIENGRHPVVAYDPADDAWEEVPGAPKRQIINIIPGNRRPVTPAGEMPIEYPPGAADLRGRLHWFRYSGPVVFDPREGEWHQGKRPIRYDPGPRWEGPMPRFRRSSGATATGPDGRIYLLGGLGRPATEMSGRTELLQSLEVYDPEAETWEDRAPMAQGRQLFAAAFGPDGKLYAFGGFGAKGRRQQREGESDQAFAERRRREIALAKNALRSVEAYDPATDTWEPRAPMPARRQNLAAVRGPAGRIYVIGGSPSYMDPAPRPQVYVYDPRRDAWSEGPPLREARMNHAAAMDAEGRIYAISGLGGREREEWSDLLRDEPRYEMRALRSVERLDLAKRDGSSEGAAE